MEDLRGKCPLRVGVIGAGTWGTALSIILCHNHQDVTIYAHSEDKLRKMLETRRHPNLPGAVLPESLKGSTDVAASPNENDILLVAVPSVHVRETTGLLRPSFRKGQIIISAAKGIEDPTLFTMSDVIQDELPDADVAVLSGPTHAEEVSKLMPTAIAAGAGTRETAELVQRLFMCSCFRVYINSDVRGMEIGGALKNVIALAAGAADGLGCGDNAKAALITRGIAEIGRLGIAMGCKIETFAGLSGIGDLVVTCTSTHSRNRKAGFLMGRGESCEQAMHEVGQVVEGVNAARAALKLAEKYHVSMPIVENINEVIFDGKPVREAVQELMERAPRAEHRNVSYAFDPDQLVL